MDYQHLDSRRLTLKAENHSTLSIVNRGCRCPAPMPRICRSLNDFVNSWGGETLAPTCPQSQPQLTCISSSLPSMDSA